MINLDINARLALAIILDAAKEMNTMPEGYDLDPWGPDWN